MKQKMQYLDFLFSDVKDRLNYYAYDPKDYFQSSIKPLRFENNVREWLNRQKRSVKRPAIAGTYMLN